MAACDACISLAGIVVELVIIMALLTVSRACNIRSCLIGVSYVLTRCLSGLDSSKG